MGSNITGDQEGSASPPHSSESVAKESVAATPTPSSHEADGSNHEPSSPATNANGPRGHSHNAETDDEKASRVLPILKSALDNKSVSFAMVATARYVVRGLIKMSDEHVSAANYLYPKLIKSLADNTGVMAEFYWAPDSVACAALLEKPRKLFGIHLEPRKTLVSVCNPTEPAGVRQLATDLDKAADEGVRLLFRRTRNEALDRAYRAYTHILGEINSHAKDAKANEPPARGKSRTILTRSKRNVGSTKKGAERMDYLRNRVINVREYIEAEAKRTAEYVYQLGTLFGFAVVVAIAITLGLLEPTASVAGLKVAEFAPPMVAGGLGAMFSVMLRIDNATLGVDWRAGRTAVLITGFIRPLIGALSADAVFLLVKTGFVSIAGSSASQSDPFFIALGFIAGFGERWLPQILSSASKSVGSANTHSAEKHA